MPAPNLADGLLTTIDALGLPPSVTIAIDPHRDTALAGTCFRVSRPADDDHGHVRLADVSERLEAARLAPAVRTRALAIFTLLAEAEGAVHGTDPAEVTFHEVGAWDSIVDIVAAAFLIEALGPARWSCGAIPLGSGRVRCAHGLLPVPAPAVVHLLRGLATHDDGIAGERVTPTGAAILKHLAPDQAPARESETLAGVGTGFGSRALPDLSNVLRVLEFAPIAPAAMHESVAVLRFENRRPDAGGPRARPRPPAGAAGHPRCRAMAGLRQEGPHAGRRTGAGRAGIVGRGARRGLRRDHHARRALVARLPAALSPEIRRTTATRSARCG